MGYFSLVLLDLVDAEYKFLWVIVEASGSSFEAQIFNRSKLNRRIENGTLGLPPPEPLGPRGPNLHYFLLGNDAFALVPWLVKPYSRRQLTREERIANYRISRGQEGGGELFWYTCKKIQVAADHHGAEAKSGQRHCVNMCGANQHAEKPSGASRQTTQSSRGHTTTTQ